MDKTSLTHESRLLGGETLDLLMSSPLCMDTLAALIDELNARIVLARMYEAADKPFNSG